MFSINVQKEEIGWFDCSALVADTVYIVISSCLICDTTHLTKYDNHTGRLCWTWSLTLQTSPMALAQLVLRLELQYIYGYSWMNKADLEGTERFQLASIKSRLGESFLPFVVFDNNHIGLINVDIYIFIFGGRGNSKYTWCRLAYILMIGRYQIAENISRDKGSFIIYVRGEWRSCFVCYK